VAGVSEYLLGAASRLYAAAWEARRTAYARGWFTPERVGTRVVSIGNLSVGGAGKTTLALHLAARAAARGSKVAIVCRRYRPGPGGEGDEERLYREAVGPARCFAGRSKLELARAAAVSGAALVLVDDGFSHWPLARDEDLVLLDRTDLFGGGRLLPAGRLREPLRALHRATVVIVTRLAPGEDPAPWLEAVRPYAPAALLAAARHRVTGVRDGEGGRHDQRGAAHVVTATGNPGAVVASAREAGFAPVSSSSYRDHHWFTAREARREADRAGAGALLVTAKDAVRWPRLPGYPGPRVLEVGWEWVAGGEAVEARVFGGSRTRDGE
jgi:tetraacyldisaccharide 4'-kinase